ncbi:MAG TPA: hypothetical protein VNE38_13210 [Ktedonobacteraceae bacterium]|nr:hypothetical protein [Ktedonobacteraceae bacterium]
MASCKTGRASQGDREPGRAQDGATASQGEREPGRASQGDRKPGRARARATASQGEREPGRPQGSPLQYTRTLGKTWEKDRDTWHWLKEHRDRNVR